MGADYVPLEEAATKSGLHPATIRRLLRDGVIVGKKVVHRGRRRWLISLQSLRRYSDAMSGFRLDRPGPRLYLRRWNDEDDDEE